MTIHTDHPFLDPQRVPGRQLRGRLGSRVSIWTAGSLEGGAASTAAGLTVSSMLVAAGETWRAVALLDPDADLTEALLDHGTAVVSLLETEHRTVAEVFAGMAPAPGGQFKMAEFEQTSWGPRLTSAETWAGVRLESHRELGWSLEVTCVIDSITLGDDRDPLHHLRGRYVSVGA